MKKNVLWQLLMLAVVAFCVLSPEVALAGTTGTEFQTLYQTMMNWATGYLGKTVAIAAFIIGIGMGIARSSPIPALSGVVFALFVAYIPTVIDGIVSAVI